MYIILVGGLEHGFDFPYIGNFIIPTDFHIFQRGRYTWRVLAPRRVLPRRAEQPTKRLATPTLSFGTTPLILDIASSDLSGLFATRYEGVRFGPETAWAGACWQHGSSLARFEQG